MVKTTGAKVGVVKVRLYRPFVADAFIKALPKSVKRIAVLDRTKEPGSLGEPLYLDVCSALLEKGVTNLKVIGGRYGLGSKNFDPTMVKAVFDNLTKPEPLQGFTVGITDDVTHRSLPAGEPLHIPSAGVTSAIFYGMGSDGTVGATKQSARIIGNSENLYAQAYFRYSAKKSGGYTVSELRFSSKPIKADYDIEDADYVGCNKASYVDRFRLLKSLKTGGMFVLNCPWTDAELATRLPAALRREIADKKARFYTIDAQAIAESVGLGVRVNMIMETVFFHLSGVIPFDTAIQKLKEEITAAYMHEGAEVVNQNLRAVDMAVAAIHMVGIPPQWSTAAEEKEEKTVNAVNGQRDLPSTTDFFNYISRPCLRLEGDSLPVSAFTPDGGCPWAQPRLRNAE